MVTQHSRYPLDRRLCHMNDGESGTLNLKGFILFAGENVRDTFESNAVGCSP